MGDQKVALITGAARGIGLSHAKRFAESGYQVVITDIDDDAIHAAAASIGATAAGWRMDVRDEVAVAEVFARVESTFGRLDVLVNNAGTSKPAPTVEVTDADWSALLDVHLGGSFRCAKFAYPLLAGSKGSIVNTSSGAGVRGFGKRASYATAKAGIMGLTRDLAMEWVKAGIRVNTIIPGVFMTDILQANIDSGDLAVEPMTRGIPMGRFGELRELSDAVFFSGGNRDVHDRSDIDYRRRTDRRTQLVITGSAGRYPAHLESSERRAGENIPLAGLRPDIMLAGPCMLSRAG